MPDPIYLSPPHINQEARDEMQKAITSNWIAPVGPALRDFESELSKMHEGRRALAVHSCTAALHLSMRNIGIEKGDVVFIPTHTFIATADPVIYLGAEPVFIDSEWETWNMDPGLLRQACKTLLKEGKNLKAVVPVHIYGMPAKMDEILEVANEFGLHVIEDAAEALGSQYHGRPCGALADQSALSFNGNKIITTSGGGALITKELENHENALYLANQAQALTPWYEHSTVGYNYRLSNLLAAFGVGQLKVLEDRVEGKRQIFDRYGEFFEALSGDGLRFLMQPEPDGSRSNRWLTAVLLEGEGNIKPLDLQKALAEDGIESRPIWKPMHQQPVFSGKRHFGNEVSDHLFEKGICLPSGTSMTDEQFAYVLKRIEHHIVHNLNVR
ncbi:MAG: DegT/DnrJ/EryC1/StrS family aminotransferase [Bacteroidota bacterium]|nr:DegT/DnrJ/EryC1/StrS family aminotransferase [Bacteroidota bacterium]